MTLRVLIPVDDSAASLHAIDFILSHVPRYRDTVEIHLLNVQPALSSEVTRHIAGDDVKRYHRDEGVRELAGARAKLDAASTPYIIHISIGDPGQVIAHFARDLNCDEILMATRGQGLTAAVLGSVAMKVVQYAECPVLLVK